MTVSFARAFSGNAGPAMLNGKISSCIFSGIVHPVVLELKEVYGLMLTRSVPALLICAFVKVATEHW